MVPDGSRQRTDELDLAEAGAVGGNLIGKEAVIALVPGKGGEGGAADRGEKPAEQFGIDGAGAFEPAAVINAAFVQDRLVVRALEVEGGEPASNTRRCPTRSPTAPPASSSPAITTA